MGARLFIRIGVLAASSAVLTLTRADECLGRGSTACLARVCAALRRLGRRGPSDLQAQRAGKAGPGRPDYAYELDKLKFATECSRSGSSVPGAIFFTHQRRYASEKQHFTYRAAGFVIRGVLYGSFEEPKFRGTVEVHKPHCDGDRLSWTAKLAF